MRQFSIWIHKHPHVIFGVLFLGIVTAAWQIVSIPTTLLPEMSKRDLLIKINYPETEPSRVEAHLQPILSQLRRMPGLRDLTYDIKATGTLLSLVFDHGFEVTEIEQEVNARLDILGDDLPEEWDRPIVASGMSDILFDCRLLITAELEFNELSTYVQKVFVPRLKQLEGIGLIDISGLTGRRIKILYDPGKLNAWHLTVKDIAGVLQGREEFPLMTLGAGMYSHVLMPGNQELSMDELSSISIHHGKELVRLRDLAIIQDGVDTSGPRHFIDGKRAVELRIYTTDGIRIHSFKESLNKLIRNTWKQDKVKVQVIQDQTRILTSGIENLGLSLMLGGIVILIMFFFFLHDLRLALIIGILLPVSVILVTGLMRPLGMSINIISLSGLALGLGLLIDNGIIVIENILQFHIQGRTAEEACFAGVGDIYSAVLTSNITTIVMFVPLLLGGGVMAAIFSEEAIILTLLILLSVGLSFTLVPILYRMVYSRRPVFGEPHLYRILARAIGNLTFRSYHRPFFTIFIFGVLMMAATFISFYIPLEALPVSRSNERRILHEANNDMVRLQIPEHQVVSITGTPAFLNQTIQSDAEHTIIGPQAEYYADSLSGLMKGKVKVDIPPDKLRQLFRPASDEIEIKIYKGRTTFQGQTSESPFRKEVINLLGLHSRSLLPESDNILIDHAGITGPVSIEEAQANITAIPHGVGNLFLQDLKTHTFQPAKLPIHGDIYGEFSRLGMDLDRFEREGRGLIKEAQLNGYQVKLAGTYFEGVEVRRHLIILGLISVFLLYVILVVQFQSFLWPLVVLAVLPIGVAGSMIFLYFLGETLNVMSGIGIIAILGIMVNDSILKVTTIRHNMQAMDLENAVLRAHKIRLKAILMTTISTVLCCLPLLFLPGLGNELQRPLASAIIGGVLTSTAASLFLIPVICRYFCLSGIIHDKQGCSLRQPILE